jgi:SAM-dependent methyltransferase
MARGITALSLRALYSRDPHQEKDMRQLTSLGFQRSLDLGSGPVPKNPFAAQKIYGVDIRSYDQAAGRIRKCNLVTDAIPFEDAYFDSVTAYDVLEHIPRVWYRGKEQIFPVVSVMNEVWRVLKKEGYFFSITPCYPMKQAFQDPTHVNIMTEDTLRLYFCEKAWARIYGFEGTFVLVDEGWHGSHYWCLMRKNAEHRVGDRDSPQRP